ncbi:MAG: ribosomal protein S18-alanine N-acetyltransferase [Burkholderiales bacterium]
MSAQPAGRSRPQSVRLVPMAVSWLDAVMAIEVVAYPFPWTRGNFLDSLAAGHPMHCLIDGRGELLGYMVTLAGVDEIHLLNITVAPQHEGCGWARTMLHALVRHARATGLAFIWLEVRPSNARARRLYERFGFEQIGLRRGYYPAEGGQREDALVMRRAVGTDPPSPERPHAVD